MSLFKSARELKQSANLDADVNKDGKIGLEEAIYGLQYTAGAINKVTCKIFEESDLGISYQEETGNIRFLNAEPGYSIEQPIPLDSSATSEDAARSFLSVYGTVFSIKNQETELDVIKTQTAQGKELRKEVLSVFSRNTIIFLYLAVN